MSNLNAWLVFPHVLGAMVWLGAWTATSVFAFHTVRHPGLAAIRRLFSVMRLLGPVVHRPQFWTETAYSRITGSRSAVVLVFVLASAIVAWQRGVRNRSPAVSRGRAS
jgi:hypothetical protein